MNLRKSVSRGLVRPVRHTGPKKRRRQGFGIGADLDECLQAMLLSERVVDDEHKIRIARFCRRRPPVRFILFFVE
eukprot:2276902-Lingulodinium_polyedra.AAC.1